MVVPHEVVKPPFLQDWRMVWEGAEEAQIEGLKEREIEPIWSLAFPAQGVTEVLAEGRHLNVDWVRVEEFAPLWLSQVALAQRLLEVWTGIQRYLSARILLLALEFANTKSPSYASSSSWL